MLTVFKNKVNFYTGQISMDGLEIIEETG